MTWALRIKVLSEGVGSKISFVNSVKILVSSLFAAAITPSRAGGEPVRILLLSREKLSLGNATAVILGERIFDVLVLVSMLPISLFVFKDLFKDNNLLNYVFLSAIIAFVLASGVAAYVMTSAERIKRFISLFEGVLSKFTSPERSKMILDMINTEVNNFRDGLFKLLRDGKKAMVLAILLTVATWITYFLVASFILLGLNEDPIWFPSISAMVILNIVIMIPSTPGAVGVAEVTLASLYSLLIENLSIIGVFVLIWRFITYYINLIIGGIISLKILRDIDLNEMTPK